MLICSFENDMPFASKVEETPVSPHVAAMAIWWNKIASKNIVMDTDALMNMILF